MEITRITEAQPYDAPGHFGMACLRLQGKEATGAKSMWMALSHLLPGGRTSLKASDQEKLYFVVEGLVTISNGSDEAVLSPRDSCLIAPGEGRELRNDTTLPATILLVMQETSAS
ncbi:Cupin domain-containing protein [Poseidonocella pacifica]|uniref:Cupin domain-containing protein n=1 Tax=Poseidonocella pacifica TaxID=871651 RepID=A0A1I0V239_9RHOB|nr:cupin domain-containing protein [Poseidonocella pacifica]SFA70394.1 Cupin domain-containing protein [Poseidonocella pacifica]